MYNSRSIKESRWPQPSSKYYIIKGHMQLIHNYVCDEA